MDMVKKTSAILLCFLLFLALQSNDMPSITLNKLGGGTIKANEINNNGKPILIYVWDVSCQPGIRGLDNIAKSFEQWQKETGVKVVAISVDDNRNYFRVSPLVASKGWPFEFYQDKNQDFKRAVGAQICPYMYVMDSNRNIVWRKAGYSPGDENIAYSVIKKVANGEKFTE